MVLLKNDGGLLPLPTGTGRVAVIGPNGKAARIMGGGSAQLNAFRAVSPWEGLVARLGADRVSFAQGCSNDRWQPILGGPLEVAYFDNPDLAGAPVLREEIAEAQQFWVPPVAGGRVDPQRFSARITGRFTAPQASRYGAGVHATGPVRMRVAGVTVAEAWDDWRAGRTFFEEGCDEVTGEVDLAAGQEVEVAVEMRARPGAGLGFSAVRAGIGLPAGAPEIAEAARLAAEADAVILCLGRSGEWDTEGSDLDGIALPGAQDALAEAVLAANPRCVVLLQSGGPVKMPWIDRAPAVLQAWYPGQEAGHAVADVLFGDAEPGGRLPQTFPRRRDDNPAEADAAARHSGPGGHIAYAEGLFTGHRHHDRSGVAPLFPFGHGAGYTTFALTDLDVVPSDPPTFAVTLANTGPRRGSSLVMLFLGPEPAPQDRPARRLAAFAKLTLDPGAQTRVTLAPDARAFEAWRPDAQAWKRLHGGWRAEVGFSAGDIRLMGQLAI